MKQGAAVFVFFLCLMAVFDDVDGAATPATEQLSYDCIDGDYDTEATVCCTSDTLPGGCACFDIPFHEVNLAELPQCSSTNSTSFILKNKAFPDGTEIKASDGIKEMRKSFRGPTKKVYFIVIGWTTTADKIWVRSMQQGLLLREPHSHVVLVDWEEAAADWSYTPAVANARVVAVMLSQLICRLHGSVGIRMEDVHLIGHSLGAQLAGMAGTELQRVCGATVGRITGLDPASGMMLDADDAAILDASDATFVDILHTNGEDFTFEETMAAYMSGNDHLVPRGMPRSTGHVDFWPNGGKQQPGCESHSCSHNRVPWLYLASILNLCEFTSAEEPSCAMGFNVDTSCSGDLNVTTTDTFPFCE